MVFIVRIRIKNISLSPLNVLIKYASILKSKDSDILEHCVICFEDKE